MSYTALYRKFRPATFDEVKGQDPIVRTLRNQILNGRVGHAYLFCGTRGTGKTSVAKIFAKAVNCEHPDGANPCGKCASCLAAASGNSTNIIEIDAASNNSVDNVRNIRDEVAYRPVEGRYKVYIIDEVHMLSTGAFNALLKTLEEPPEYVIFILATTESAKIPVTILSRCQRYDFRRISAEVIYERLKELTEKEGTPVDEKGLRYLARLGDGSMRDALSLLDQCISCCGGGNVTYDDIIKALGSADTDELKRVTDSIFDGDVAGSIRALDEFALSGKEMSHFASDMTMYLRSMLIARNSDDSADLLDMSEENFAALREFCKDKEPDKIMRCLRIFSELTGILRNSAMKRVDTELAIIKACRPETEKDNISIAQRLEKLEQQFEKGLPVKEVIREMPAKEAKAEQPPKEEFVQRAAGDDLKKIAQHWQELIQDEENSLSIYFAGSVPEYDTAADEDILHVVINNPLSLDRIINEKNIEDKEKFETKLKRFVNKAINVKYTYVKDKDKRIKPVPIEKIVEKEMTIPLEVE